VSAASERPRGLYFEEFSPGLEITTAGRTITETDVVNFAGLSGDFNQIHLDQEYSLSTPIGARIAHGLLILAVTSGLAVQTGILDDTVIVFREVSDWKFVKPVFFGDTVHALLTVRKTKPIRMSASGLVTIDVRVLNQYGEMVNKGVWLVLVASRPA